MRQISGLLSPLLPPNSLPRIYQVIKDKNHEIFVRQTTVNVFLLYLDLPKVFITRWYMLRWILATEESIQSKKKKKY
jgi:hypothetical protein